MVLTEFVDMVEQRSGREVLDRVMQASALGHELGYTAVGYYPLAELQRLLTSLCQETDTQPADMLATFGAHLFDRLQAGHPQFFSLPGLDLFGLLEQLDSVVHVEVRKLYAEATLPKFDCERLSDDVLLMRYESERGLADLAVGLLEGAAAHFGELIDLERTDAQEAEIYRTDFRIRRVRLANA